MAENWEPHFMEAELDRQVDANLWTAIRKQLDRLLPNWRQRIEELGQVAAVERRETGNNWCDDQVFEALLRAVLSNNTDWAKVECVIPELRNAFSGFSLEKYADTTDEDVDTRLIPWFKHRNAASMTLRRSLVDLGKTSRILRDWSTKHGSAEDYFLEVMRTSDDDPKMAAKALGENGSGKKLPGLGVPLAAETLRNMGFDLSKPDRHICRAMGSFGLVRFRNWPDRTGTKPPSASAPEMLKTMTIVERMAMNVGERPTFVDNAIWLLCCKGGVHLSNHELEGMVTDATASRE